MITIFVVAVVEAERKVGVENEYVHEQVPDKKYPVQEGVLQIACLIRVKVAHEGVCGGDCQTERSVGQDHSIHDVDNAIAGAYIRGDYSGIVDEHCLVHNPNRDVRTIGGHCSFQGDDLGSRDFTRYHVVGQDFNELVLVFRQQQHFHGTVR